MATAMLVITAVSAAGSAVMSHKAGKEQEKANKDRQRALAHQAEKQRKIDDIRAQRERVKAVRAQRKATAQAQAAQESSGVFTSTTAGTIGTIKSQTTSAVGAALQTGRALEEISIFNQQMSASAQNHMNRAGRFQGGADLFKAAGKVASIFR